MIDIRAYVDGADGVDLDAILSVQGNADIGAFGRKSRTSS